MCLLVEIPGYAEHLAVVKRFSGSEIVIDPVEGVLGRLLGHLGEITPSLCAIGRYSLARRLRGGGWRLDCAGLIHDTLGCVLKGAASQDPGCITYHPLSRWGYILRSFGDGGIDGS